MLVEAVALTLTLTFHL